MQAWITGQLTHEGERSTIVGVRPKPSATPSAYKRAFVQRVRAARLSQGKTPAEMAQLLSVPKDTYHRYETRTLLPHHLIEFFCELTASHIEWLITGIPRLEGLPRRSIGTAPSSGSPGESTGRLTG